MSECVCKSPHLTCSENPVIRVKGFLWDSSAKHLQFITCAPHGELCGHCRSCGAMNFQHDLQASPHVCRCGSVDLSSPAITSNHQVTCSVPSMAGLTVTRQCCWQNAVPVLRRQSSRWQVIEHRITPPENIDRKYTLLPLASRMAQGLLVQSRPVSEKMVPVQLVVHVKVWNRSTSNVAFTFGNTQYHGYSGSTCG